MQEENHHGGSRPWPRYIEETVKATGRRPSRGQMFIKFYTAPDGEIKDAHAKAVAETIKRLEAEGCSLEWSPNDSLAQAMNKPEHRGHIRMLGAGLTKNQVFGTAAAESSTSGSVSSTMPHKPAYVQQLENRVSQLETILRSVAPSHFVGSSSSTAVPQTQTQQPYVPQPPPSQPNDQSQFADIDFDLDNLPAHLAYWMNNVSEFNYASN
ncbi:hypothetical protein LINPERHAP1_LOCUS5940 [Linum perenne]